MSMRRIALSCLILISSFAAAADEIDWNRARELHRKATSGQPLTAEERAYYERAKAERAKQGGPGAQAVREPKSSTGFVPLTAMARGDQYKGEDGGLYGGGRNEPPQAHLDAALREASQIRPLDADGKPSPGGKVVLLSIGMSNTTQEFSRFQRLAAGDRELSPQLVIVDGAQGGMDAKAWTEPGERGDPWAVLDRRLRQARVSDAQVQAVWLKQARISPASVGEHPKHTNELAGHVETILHRLKHRFPNLRIAYLSSRIYGGYATGGLNPEPYAYESAFAVRSLIREQIEGDGDLNFDSAKGDVRAPLLLWGPYLWADGEKGRKGDDLVWTREDLGPDGTHPSDSGRDKVARLLLDFFKTDPTAKAWFLKAGDRPQE